MVDFIRTDSNMIGFVYFNFDKEADWKVWDGFEVSEGWAEAVQAPDVVHQWPLTRWFQPGPIPSDPFPVPPQLTMIPAGRSEVDPPSFEPPLAAADLMAPSLG